MGKAVAVRFHLCYCRCMSDHSMSLAKQCERAAAGHCPFGNECWFIHAPKSIAPTSPNSGRQIVPDDASPTPVPKYEPPHRKVVKSSGDSTAAPSTLSGASSPVSVQSQAVSPRSVSSATFISAQVANSGLAIVKQGRCNSVIIATSIL